jgi:hypothetical protein
MSATSCIPSRAIPSCKQKDPAVQLFENGADRGGQVEDGSSSTRGVVDPFLTGGSTAKLHGGLDGRLPQFGSALLTKKLF